MVMKDKLVKNHHKGIYFTLKRWTLVILASATFLVAIVVPTYIVTNLSADKKAGIAEEEPQVVEVDTTKDNEGENDENDDSNDNVESEEPFEYETYTQHSK